MDEWQIYREMVAYGASPLDVYFQAKADGLSVKETAGMLYAVFDNGHPELRSTYEYVISKKYVEMAANGTLPEDVVRQSRQDGYAPFTTIVILRNTFSMTLKEATDYAETYGDFVNMV